jgi:RNA polymerase sigma-70 factor (sigma-E family)
VAPDDERAFSAFLAVSGDGLLRTATLLAGDHQGGQDLLQTVLVKALRHWPRIRDEQPAAYLRRALATTAVDEARRRRWREVHSAHLPEPGVRDRTATVDDRDALLRALRALPPRQRAVVVLRYYADLSEAETARELGISTGTVKSTASKALAALRVSVPHREELA